MPLDFSSSIEPPAFSVPPQPAVPTAGKEGDPAVGAARYDLCCRLMESFLHEARNPLNVLSINLDVLTQRLKGPSPAIDPEKYCRAMREQIQRVDAIMRDFSEFLSPETGRAYDGDFSQTLARAIRVAGHELRRGKVRLNESVQPDLRVSGFTFDSICFVALQPVLRAVVRCPPGSGLEVRARSEGGRVHFFVRDSGDDALEPFPFAVDALKSVCAGRDGTANVRGPETTISLPAG